MHSHILFVSINILIIASCICDPLDPNRIRPIDMRQPCTQGSNTSTPCSQSIDIIPSIHLPRGFDCLVELMPLTPFPCNFDNLTFDGIQGQPSDLCNSRTHPDRYESIISSPCTAASSGVGRAVLRLFFFVAEGRQFDRTWTAVIDEALIALGTTTEPSKWGQGDKWWTVAREVAHLAPLFLSPISPNFSFQLENYLSNVYNVPVWANASIEITYVSSASEFIPKAPTQVLPLPLTSIAGDGSTHWPNATFKPSSSQLYREGGIVRAMVEVFVKASACEEFWALNPSGMETNSTCNGISTGEPYRELRVHINGQLAGLSPIYYTIYTGGVAPMLWSAIVSYSAHLLPSYSFDLGPWIGILNEWSTESSEESRSFSVTIEVVGASNEAFDLGGSLILTRKEGVKVVSTSSPSYITGLDPQDPTNGRVYSNNADFGPLMSACTGLPDPLRLFPSYRRYHKSSGMIIKATAARAGECMLRVPAHGFYAYNSLSIIVDGVDHVWFSATSSWVLESLNVVGFSSSEDDPSSESYGLYSISVEFEVASSTLTDGGEVIDDSNRSFSWATSGEIKQDGVWTNSYNASSSSHGAQVSNQSHYQRLLLKDTTNSKCIVDRGLVTHTVHLEASDATHQLQPAVTSAETSWADVELAITIS